MVTYASMPKRFHLLVEGFLVCPRRWVDGADLCVAREAAQRLISVIVLEWQVKKLDSIYENFKYFQNLETL